jgi:transcriptional regulator with XRE-family HTH domain
MEMKIDGMRVRREREQRAWTQEHLAGATGLSLRTIQRIESTGTASFESFNALAAVFSLSVSDLRLVEAAPGQPVARTRWLTGRRMLTLAAALIVSSVLTPPSVLVQVPVAIALWLGVELGMLAWRRSRTTAAH